MVKATSFLLLGAVIAAVSAGSVTIPLRQRNQPTLKQANQADNHRWAELKTTHKIIPALNADFSYYIDVEIGTPAQQTELLFDTGSSLLWTSNTQFVSAHSKTAKNQKFSNILEYGSGNVTIEFFKDTVNVGGLKIEQEFGVAGNTTDIGIEGIIGFGPTDLAGAATGPNTTVVIPTPMDNWYHTKKISSEVVGVNFRPISNGANQTVNGQIDIGGVDSSKFKGKMHYVPLTKVSPEKYYWGLDVDSISFGNKEVVKKTAGVVDTGTTLLSINPKYITALFGHIKGAGMDPNSGVAVIPHGELSKAQDITFRIGGKAFTLTPSQYIIPQNQYAVWGLDPKAGLHYTYLSTSYFGLDVILGQKFLEHFYSVFDTNRNRIGLAPTK